MNNNKAVLPKRKSVASQLLTGRNCIHHEHVAGDKIFCSQPAERNRANGYLCVEHQSLCEHKTKAIAERVAQPSHEQSIINHDVRIIAAERGNDSALTPEKLIAVIGLPRHYTVH